VFGDVPYLAPCAARIHDLAHGSPRVAMELAQHLVDSGLARYEDGSWSLPAQLQPHDLPADLHASLLARVSAVSEDARELMRAAPRCTRASPTCSRSATATRSGAVTTCSARAATARRSSCCAASTSSSGCRRCRCS
jgi:hypothetical protein